MSSPVTVLECFNTKLPSLAPNQPKYEKIEASGKTTAQTAPPRYLHTMPVEPNISKANELLKSARLQNSQLKQRHITSAFDGLSLDGEAGVVLATDLYILQPILEIPQELYPCPWEIHSEFSELSRFGAAPATTSTTATAKKTGRGRSDTNGDGNPGSRSRKPQALRLRYDLMFREKSTGKVILILEYKKRGQFQCQDFENAIVTSNRDEKAIKRELAFTNSSTALTDNGETYVKQIVRYAANTGRRHAAPSNRDHFIGCKIHELCGLSTTTKISAGQTASMFWVQETGHDGAEDLTQKAEFIKEGKLRKVKLGWIYTCFVEHGFTDVT